MDYLRQIRVLRDESKWNCPICECKTSPSNLYVDDFILSIAETYQEDKDRVEIRKDGTWEVCQAPVAVARANVKKVLFTYSSYLLVEHPSCGLNP